MRLSDLFTDFDQLEGVMQRNLATNSTTFQALFPGETGTVLVELLAGLTAMLTYRINMAVLNQYMPTAFAKSAVSAIASTMGHPPHRKTGASMIIRGNINSTILAPLTIPAFTRFAARSLSWYTRSDYVIKAGDTTIDIDVYEGELNEVNFTSDGTEFQRYTFSDDFQADNFLIVSVDSLGWQAIDGSLIEATGDFKNSYAETTTPDGKVMVLFGNGTYGAIPTANKTINIKYFTTVGFVGNSSVIGDDILMIDTIAISSTETLDVAFVSYTVASGGDEEESSDTLKFTSPRLYAANRRAVRRDDYKALLVKFGGIVASQVWGEYEQSFQLGFADNTMLNRVYFSVIKSDAAFKTQAPYSGDGSTLNFTFTFNIHPIVQGSIKITDGTTVWYDPGEDAGILTSDTVSFDQFNAGTASASSTNGSSAVANAFDNSIFTDWQSNATPTNNSYIRIAYDLGSGVTKVGKSIRFRAASYPDVNTRAFAYKVSIWGTNTATPSLTLDSDWTILHNTMILLDPGATAWTPWIALRGTTAYRRFSVKITDRYGTSSYVRLGEIELQDSTHSSVVNLTTGVTTVKYSSAPIGGSTASSTYLAPELTADEQLDISNYIEKYNHFTTQLTYLGPIAKRVDIVCDIYYGETFSVQTVQADVVKALDALFSFNLKSIGTEIFLSDIYETINSVAGVDYIQLHSPTTDLPMGFREFPLLANKTLNMILSSRG